MHVDKLSWNCASLVLSTAQVSFYFVAKFGHQQVSLRVDESESSHGQLGASLTHDESWIDTEDKGVKESICNVVIGKVFAIHGNFHLKDIRLGVLGHVYLDGLTAQDLSWHHSSILIISKAHNHLGAIILWALEVLSIHDGGLIIWTLDWSEVRFNCSNNWSIII